MILEEAEWYGERGERGEGYLTFEGGDTEG
jgi:hypothetical protein